MLYYHWKSISDISIILVPENSIKLNYFLPTEENTDILGSLGDPEPPVQFLHWQISFLLSFPTFSHIPHCSVFPHSLHHVHVTTLQVVTPLHVMLTWRADCMLLCNIILVYTLIGWVSIIQLLKSHYYSARKGRHGMAIF